MGGQQWPRCVMPTTPLPDSTKLKPLPVSKPRPKTDSRHKERAKKANSTQQHNTHREMMRAAPPHSPPIISSQCIHKQITRTEYHHMTQQPPALPFHARLAQIGELTGRRTKTRPPSFFEA